MTLIPALLTVADRMAVFMKRIPVMMVLIVILIVVIPVPDNVYTRIFQTIVHLRVYVEKDFVVTLPKLVLSDQSHVTTAILVLPTLAPLQLAAFSHKTTPNVTITRDVPQIHVSHQTLLIFTVLIHSTLLIVYPRQVVTPQIVVSSLVILPLIVASV